MAIKRVLITAGPTWVAIDKVRVISNKASGETGVLIAEKLCAQGVKVALILGPVGNVSLNKKIRLIRFQYFDELKHILFQELKNGSYDCLIHSAAVSDYRPRKIYPGKISSGLKAVRLNLVPAEKLINLIRRKNKKLFLIGFKFETQATKKKLINETRDFMRNSDSDLVVANTNFNNRYKAYIVKDDGISGPIFSKKKLAEKLIGRL